MRWRLWLILAIQAILVAFLAVAVGTGVMPLGVRGEWQWMRLAEDVNRSWEWFTLALVGVAVYAAFVGLGFRAMRRAESRRAEALWLAALVVVSIAVQVDIPSGAPYGYGLTKWAYVNYLSGSSGYFQIARDQAARDPWRFLARYPGWIETQDSLHIGTHPPGLIVAQCILLTTMERNPALSGFLADSVPSSVQAGFRSLDAPIRRSERAALYATALLTLVA